MILPTAKSNSFLRAAASVAASSGKLVPMATIVKPIIKSLTSKNSATSTAPQTKRREEPINTAIPMISHFIAAPLPISSGNSSRISCGKLSSP